MRLSISQIAVLIATAITTACAQDATAPRNRPVETSEKALTADESENESSEPDPDAIPDSREHQTEVIREPESATSAGVLSPEVLAKLTAEQAAALQSLPPDVLKSMTREDLARFLAEHQGQPNPTPVDGNAAVQILGQLFDVLGKLPSNSGQTPAGSDDVGDEDEDFALRQNS